MVSVCDVFVWPSVNMPIIGMCFCLPELPSP